MLIPRLLGEKLLTNFYASGIGNIIVKTCYLGYGGYRMSKSEGTLWPMLILCIATKAVFTQLHKFIISS